MPFSLFFIVSCGLASAGYNYTDVAIQGQNWVISTAIQTPDGVYWPANLIGQDSHIDYNRTFDLYSGIAGVCIGLLETHNAVGSPTASPYMDTAVQAANYMLAKLDYQIQHRFDPNLYHGGMMGVAFAFWEMYKATGNLKYQQGALTTLQYIQSLGPAPYDPKWAGSLRWGDSGIGFGFLYFYEALQDSQYLQAAADIGVWVISQAVKANGGLKWYVQGKSGAEYPNYAEGTSGNGYFLITLYHFTKDPQFLQAAEGAATYLLSIANTDNGGCLVYHDNTNGNSFYYLGECNGPSGTSRFFLRMSQVDGSSWFTWAERSVLSIRQHAPIKDNSENKFNWVYSPTKREPVWRNYGQCDGAAAGSEASLLLAQSNSSDAAADLSFALDVADDIIEHGASVGTSMGPGFYVVSQEWRTDPTTFNPQVGYMQGAAGLGSLFFGLDSFLGNLPDNPRIALPDSPWAFGFCCPKLSGSQQSSAKQRYPPLREEH